MSVRAPAGSIGKTEYDAVIGRGVAAIKGNEFIFQSLLKKEIHGYWKNISCGSTFESLNSDDIKNAILSLPSSLEQTKIGKLFSNIDTLIEKQEDKYNKLLDIKKSLLNKMFPLENADIPSIRFNGYSEKWEVNKLGEIGEYFSVSPLSNKEIDLKGIYNCLTYGELFTNFNELIKQPINKTNKEVTKSKYNDLLFPTSTTVDALSLITPSAVLINNLYVGGDLFILRLLKDYSASFLSYFINAPLWLKTKLSHQAQGITIIHISFNNIEYIEIPIPVTSEQIKIGKLFEQIDNLTNLYTSKINKLETIKQSLLNRMFV